MLNEQRIKSFLVLARRLNFTHAAEELHITQQALSAQISALEKDVGAPLFIRDTRRVSLTPLGAALTEFFESSTSEYRRIVSRYVQPTPMMLRICCFEDMDIGVEIYHAVTDLCRAYPGLEYSLSFRGSLASLAETILADIADIALLPQGIELPPDKFRVDPICNDHAFLCFAPKLCPGAEHPTPADLKDAMFFLGSDRSEIPVTGIRLQQYCARYGFRPKVYTEKQLTPSVERVLIESGAGVGMGGRFSMLSRNPKLMKIPLDINAPIVAIRRHSAPDTRKHAVLDEFVEKLRAVTREQE